MVINVFCNVGILFVLVTIFSDGAQELGNGFNVDNPKLSTKNTDIQHESGKMF